MEADDVVRIALACHEHAEVHALHADRRDHWNIQFAGVGISAKIDPVRKVKTVLNVVLHTRLGHNGKLKNSVRPKVRISQRRHYVIT